VPTGKGNIPAEHTSQRYKPDSLTLRTSSKSVYKSRVTN